MEAPRPPTCFRTARRRGRSVPANTNPFTEDDKTLRITAFAHTYAYFRFPQERNLEGFVIKLKQGTDGGMSWGPGALVRWPGGAQLRVGLRSDGLLQADTLGKQLLAKGHTTTDDVAAGAVADAERRH